MAQAQFVKFGAQKPADWRYFPLARSHQGLLAELLADPDSCK
jgi:hypothetical protein